ncbi:unnamed protein product [Heterobilharzia americana]|nr:unnamed protein product [Heterobilharzia americana]
MKLITIFSLISSKQYAIPILILFTTLFIEHYSRNVYTKSKQKENDPFDLNPNKNNYPSHLIQNETVDFRIMFLL